jgi:hypothetical protein
MLYLLGLVNWLLAEADKEEVEKREDYIDSREALERFIKVCRLVSHQSLVTAVFLISSPYMTTDREKAP